MACCKRLPIWPVAVAIALSVAGWASAGCGALIGVDPGDPIDPAPGSTVTLDDPSIGAGDDQATDAASEPSKAEAGTASSPASPDEDAEASATSVAEGPGEPDPMAESSGPSMPQARSNPSPEAAPKGDADASACPKGDQGGGGSGKGPGPGCMS